MINTYLDIRLKDENGKKAIDKVFYCNDRGREEINALSLCNRSGILGSSSSTDLFSFGFSNLCANYPYRILIYNETCPPSGEYEWYNGANFNLMYAYYRLTKIFGDALLPRIDYNNIYYSFLYKISNVNGIDYLYFSSNENLPDTLLLFPLLFYKRVGKDVNGNRNVYIAYNPPVGLDSDVGNPSSISLNYFYSSASKFSYTNEYMIKNGTNVAMQFPFLGVNSGLQIWNIDLDKLNLGYHIARYVETYE